MHRVRFGLVLVAALSVFALKTHAQTDSGRVHFTATAVNMEAPTGMVAMPLDIVLERWSNDQERDQVMNAMLEGAPGKLLDVIRHLPRIGGLHSPGTVGWDLRYARHAVGTDGRDRITILTDRPISFGEMRDQPRTIDYPFTVIELRIGSNGKGEGQLTIGTKITMDKATGTLVLENYNIQQVALNNVQREK
jgi:hypothetical protein